jgi:hypothetical protein
MSVEGVTMPVEMAGKEKGYPMSFRLDEDTFHLIQSTAEQLGVSQRDVIRMSVRVFARRQGVTSMTTTKKTTTKKKRK